LLSVLEKKAGEDFANISCRPEDGLPPVVRQNHIRLKKLTFRRATPDIQMHVQAFVFGHQSSGSPCTP